MIIMVVFFLVPPEKWMRCTRRRLQSGILTGLLYKHTLTDIKKIVHRLQMQKTEFEYFVHIEQHEPLRNCIFSATYMIIIIIIILLMTMIMYSFLLAHPLVLSSPHLFHLLKCLSSQFSVFILQGQMFSYFEKSTTQAHQSILPLWLTFIFSRRVNILSE